MYSLDFYVKLIPVVVFMEGNNLTKFLHTNKTKFKRKPVVSPSMSEYAFKTEELKELIKDNIEKIKTLKKELIDTKKDLKDNNLEESLALLNSIQQNNNEESLEENKEEKEESTTPSFINLETEYQDLIMSKWQSINLNEIDKDIITGKDLLNHNYTITFADESLKYINEIRKKYEIIICYLIGFNNEKKGIYNKTTFANKKENEWKHLNNYIKLLEKIRNFKLHSS